MGAPCRVKGASIMAELLGRLLYLRLLLSSKLYPTVVRAVVVAAHGACHVSGLAGGGGATTEPLSKGMAAARSAPKLTDAP
ncbi:hypothetical protein E2C01_027290 [Portunus trituberculatus]|uniref:Secreted protein n=1 Tax=Portunus trituberculatus TaxID=210409 RepID=A0A5B7EHS9_PORTR|nr:hypothetical protein [Portunus trituberculatus]